MTNSQPRTLDAAMDGDCLKGVRRTAGVIAADLAVERADRGPIGLEQGNQDIFHRRAPVFTGLDRGLDRTLPKHWSRSAASWGPEAAPEAGVARTTSTRSAERRVGKEGVRTGRLWWSTDN